MRKLIFLSCLTTLFYSFALYQNVLAEDNAEKNLTARSLIDRIIDLTLSKIKNEIPQPIALKDVIKQIRKKILLLPIEAQIILYEGKLWGIDSIKRNSDAEFHFHNLHIVDVNSTFQFDLLNFSYDFQTNIFKLSTNGKMQGNITQLVADVGLLIDLRNKIIELTSLRLVKAKVLRIQIDSQRYADKFINYILKLITSNFKIILLTQMETELQNLLGRTIHFNFKNES